MMMKQCLGAFSVILAAFVCATLAAPSTDIEPHHDEVIANDKDILIQEIIRPLRRLAQEADHLQKIVESLLHEDDTIHPVLGMFKRQGAQWEGDYAWGGGRFGKRNGGDKRYDMYGMSGRFGRDLRRIQAMSQK